MVIETMVAIREAALILDEPITKKERIRQHQKARKEAEIGRKKVVPTSQRQR